MDAGKLRVPSHLLPVGAMTAPMIFALLLGYLLGSIPFGLLLARAGGKGDIREIGSGNIGATNVLRTGSKALAALTLVLDCLKATAAILIAHALWRDVSGTFAGTGAMLGHLYPLWLKFKGGKGVATFLGVLIPLMPMLAAVYAAVWLILLLTIRISSVSGLAAAASAPIMGAILGLDEYFPMLLGLAILVFWKHRENIRRILSGTEPAIGSKD